MHWRWLYKNREVARMNKPLGTLIFNLFFSLFLDVCREGPRFELLDH